MCQQGESKRPDRKDKITDMVGKHRDRQLYLNMESIFFKVILERIIKPCRHALTALERVGGEKKKTVTVYRRASAQDDLFHPFTHPKSRNTRPNKHVTKTEYAGIYVAYANERKSISFFCLSLYITSIDR